MTVENNIEEDIKILENFINWLKTDFEYNSGEEIKAIEHILSNYKRILKKNEELNKNYNSLINKIILKIDEYDYKFEKAKRQNKNDIADYYWDLIVNFKKLLDC